MADFEVKTEYLGEDEETLEGFARHMAKEKILTAFASESDGEGGVQHFFLLSLGQVKPVLFKDVSVLCVPLTEEQEQDLIRSAKGWSQTIQLLESDPGSSVN